MRIVLTESLAAWWPEVILSLGALAVFVCGAWTKRRQPAGAVTWVTLAAAAFALWRSPVPTGTDIFFGLVLCDSFSLVFRWLALGAAALTILMTSASRDVDESLSGEYLGLVLLVGVGMMVMAEANHLLTAYVGIELVSLCAYDLVGFTKDARSSEASVKYLIYGALASGVMLFGMSLLFGLTGHLDFASILARSSELNSDAMRLLLVAVVLMWVGLAFKISMVPFHMWTPDAYEGAPVPVAALLSVGPKAAGLALVLRVMEALAPAWAALEPMLLVLVVITMTLGNGVALVQTNIKRLLAYSTIAQVGYLLIGVLAHSRFGTGALLYYLTAYLFMNMGAFACVVAVVRETQSESIDAFAGLSRRAPGLAALFAICLLSLAGIPPLMGFFGKFLIFGAALDAGLLGLAVAGAINSVIALYYYVNVIRQMYLVAPAAQGQLKTPAALRLAVGVCATATLVFGLFPDTMLSFFGASSLVNLL